MRDFTIVVDPDKLSYVDKNLIDLLDKNAIDYIKNDDRDEIDIIFDNIMYDAMYISERDFGDVSVIETPISDMKNLKSVKDLSILEHSFFDDLINENPVIENSILILFSHRLKKMKSKIFIDSDFDSKNNDIYNELNELYHYMIRGDKIASLQKFQHIINLPQSIEWLKLRAFLYVLHEFYFENEIF